MSDQFKIIGSEYSNDAVESLGGRPVYCCDGRLGHRRPHELQPESSLDPQIAAESGLTGQQVEVFDPAFPSAHSKKSLQGFFDDGAFEEVGVGASPKRHRVLEGERPEVGLVEDAVVH